MSDVQTVETTETERELRLDDGGDHDRFAHYVRKNRIVESAVEGSAVVALCGKKWVPTRNPDRYPICPTCREIYEQMRSSEGGPGDEG